MNELDRLVRPEILNLKAYSSARSEYMGLDQIQLDANENPNKPYGDKTDKLNRYPEPQPQKLRDKLAEIYSVKKEELLITRGMDEGIDLLIRTFCIPYQDSITITPPTFGYYSVSANINGTNVIEVPFYEDFSLCFVQLQSIQNTKIIFLCTPNNPTGAKIPLSDIETLSHLYRGKAFIAVDEAYIEFSNLPSAVILLEHCPNVIVMRTLSKAYALAGVRIGTLIAHKDIIELLRKVIPPYPIPSPCSEIALQALSPIGLYYTKTRIEQIKQEREFLQQYLIQSPLIKKVYPSFGNFLLIIANNAEALYQDLKSKGIIVRNRTKDIPSALRITIGTSDENKLLLAALNLLPFEKNLSGRKASQSRKTNETEILCEINLDNKGLANISTGLGFFDHMLEQLAHHSRISMTIQAIGDVHVDPHHTIEDVAILLGQTLKIALGDKKGIQRFGFCLPMDESETKINLDLSGRGFCRFEVVFNSQFVGNFPTEMVKHFFESFSYHLGATIHITAKGENTHHLVESIFKCMGKTFCQAISIINEQYSSTKEVL